MKFFVTVKPGAKREKIERVDSETFIIAVKEPPVQGKANAAVLKALGDYVGIAPSRLRIISGHTGRKKVIEVS